MKKIRIADRWIGDEELTYFIADIASNHDGSLDRAKRLIQLAKEAGAEAAKFQNFEARKIVSPHGFDSLNGQLSHQAKWEKSVFEVYEEASIPLSWTEKLYQFCKEVGIHYFSSPYDFEAVDWLEPYIPAYKIGSGEITWPEMLRKISGKGKPVILATGASDIAEVREAVAMIRAINPELILMQCNTNYTGSTENFKHIHLNVLKTFQALFPEVILGLSDHTPGHATVLGAVALGARIVEKHFTDDTTRSGPDHSFSMTPVSWREMVLRTRELEDALGKTEKRVEENEKETVILQRRCLRTKKDLKAGIILTSDLIEILRPAPRDAIFPYDLERVLGRRLASDLKEGEYFKWSHLAPVN